MSSVAATPINVTYITSQQSIVPADQSDAPVAPFGGRIDFAEARRDSTIGCNLGPAETVTGAG
jgi:hypothetical protein